MIKIKRKIPEAWYCGSLIQQNHGESQDKGVLVWEIKDKNTFKVHPRYFENQNPFVSIVLNPDGTLPELALQPNCKLRLVVETPITLKQLQEAKEEAQNRFKPYSIVHVDKSERITLSEEDSIHYSQENLRDIEIQEELIYQHLKTLNLDDQVLENVLKINREVESKLEYNDETFRHLKWTINKFAWSNLFKYGEGNEIDFQKLQGLIGVFGKSYTGKSSIIDAILYTVFNSISKRAHKNVDFINDNKDKCHSKIDITVGNKEYSIIRTMEKYQKSGNTEARSTADFFSGTDKLNGIDRSETDKNIRKILGNIDDFLLTSMIPQFDTLTFVNKKNTQRKEVLAKHLDLEIFEEKFKIAQELSTDLKGAIKTAKKLDYADQISDLESKLKTNQENLDDVCNNIEKLEQQIQNTQIQIVDLQQKCTSISEKDLDLDSLEENLRSFQEKKELYKGRLEGDLLQESKLKSEILRIEEKLKTDYSGEKTVQRMYEYSLERIRANQTELKDLERQIVSAEKAEKTLCTVPCEGRYENCQFIVDAIANKSDIPNLNRRYDIAYKNRELFIKNSRRMFDLLEEVEKLDILRERHSEALKETENRIQRYENEIRSLTLKIQETQNKIDIYFKNAEQIKLTKELNLLKVTLYTPLALLKDKQQQQQKLLLESGKLTGNLEYLQNEKKRFEKQLKEYEAYELYLKCMHSNGIAYDIIKQKLPLINQEIERVLDGIFDFTIRMEAEEKKLNVFICHPDQMPRIVTIGSGAEQAIASIAITLALRTVTTLPQCDIFILDEPIGALDSDLKMSFVKFLEYIKEQFRVVILITHLDELKDVVDKELTIQQIDGCAKINDN